MGARPGEASTMSVTGIVESERLMTSLVQDLGERTTESPNNEVFGSSDCNQAHACGGEGIVSPFDRNRLTGCHALPHGVSPAPDVLEISQEARDSTYRSKR